MSDGATVVHISATAITTIHISMVRVPAGISAIDISAIGIRATTISMTKACAEETSAVKASAVEITGISPFEKRTVMGIVPIIPIVAVPGREVIIGIPGELVFIDYTIAAGIAVRVHVCALVIIGFLVDRRRCGVHLRIAFCGDQQARSSQGGECKDLFHVRDFKLYIRRETKQYI
jgi:hypothetical protein